MRVRFQFLTYTGILCLSVDVDNVTSLQPTNSHESKNYESKEKLWRGSPSAITRTWMCTHELNPLASLLQSQSSFHFFSVFVPHAVDLHPPFPASPKAYFSSCRTRSRVTCAYTDPCSGSCTSSPRVFSLFFWWCACTRDIYIYFSGARAPRGRSPKVCRFKDQEEHKLKVMAWCVRVRSDVDVHRGRMTSCLSLRRFWPDGANVVLSRKPRSFFAYHRTFSEEPT